MRSAASSESFKRRLRRQEEQAEYQRSSVADLGSGAFLTLGLGSGIGFSGIPDPKPIFFRAW
jgi:hypothetical protein